MITNVIFREGDESSAADMDTLPPGVLGGFNSDSALLTIWSGTLVSTSVWHRLSGNVRGLQIQSVTSRTARRLIRITPIISNMFDIQFKIWMSGTTAETSGAANSASMINLLVLEANVTHNTTD